MRVFRRTNFAENRILAEDQVLQAGSVEAFDVNLMTFEYGHFGSSARSSLRAGRFEEIRHLLPGVSPFVRSIGGPNECAWHECNSAQGTPQ